MGLKETIITLSAGANKLSKIQGCAEEYAALVMEELDRDNLGYIEVDYYYIYFLLRDLSMSVSHMNSKLFLTDIENTITWLRSKTMLGLVVPFDDNINFHKVVAFGIAIGVGLHAGAHLTCDFPLLLHTTDKEYESMEQFFGEERPGNYWWFVKGTEGWTGVTMVALMAIAYILAQPWFRRNRLNLPKPIKKLTGFNALFIVHGYYLYLSKKWYKKTVAVCPGNVLSLHLTKPQRVKLPKLSIDGPYGASVQDYKKYDVLLLVGLGIGSTPLISIVKDMLDNIKQQNEIEEGIGTTGGAKNMRKPFATERAYFYWVTQEQGSFE
ncbi:hypothetical protein GQ457_02G036310 [Hibiscus cannabinus]